MTFVGLKVEQATVCLLAMLTHPETPDAEPVVVVTPSALNVIWVLVCLCRWAPSTQKRKS